MNKVVLVGRLVKDPELRFTQSEKAVAVFTVACDRKFQRGEADFINCVAWNKTAEFINQYFKKGDRVSLCGHISVRSWDDDSGNRRYVTEVAVEEVEFARSKSEGGKTDNAASLPADISDFMPIDDDDCPF